MSDRKRERERTSMHVNKYYEWVCDCLHFHSPSYFFLHFRMMNTEYKVSNQGNKNELGTRAKIKHGSSEIKGRKRQPVHGVGASIFN